MASTPILFRASAILSFFSGVKDTPGVCSPSLRVVSKTLIFLGKLVDKAIPHFLSLENPMIPHDISLVSSNQLRAEYKSFSV
jgi:hypothetical protein